MRIGIIAPEFPPDVGGMQTYAHQFARELARRGCEVTVFTKAHPQGELPDPDVRVLPVLKLRRRADQVVLLQYQFDVWHVMNAAYSWLALVTEPVVVSVHGNDFLRPYILVERADLRLARRLWRLAGMVECFDRWLGQVRTTRLVKRSLSRAFHILANSHYTEQTLLERYPACKGKSSAAMVGVGDEFLQPEPADRGFGDLKRLITVCRLSEARKNVDRILCALARLKDRYDFTYTVVGSGSLRQELENLAQELGLSDRVEFTGFLDMESMKRRLLGSDLFVLAASVLPDSHEGFGIVYLEAAACGVPSLAARKAGAAEAVEDGVSGFFVEEPAVDQLEQALAQFLSGAVVFDRSACRAFAHRFTWKLVVDHAVPIYAKSGVQLFEAEVAGRSPG